jgi:hypothetical protein
VASWDVSALVGARVLFPAKDAEGAAHEARGTIVGVLQAKAAETEAEATNGSEFSVKTDAGLVMTVPGSEFSRIDHAPAPASAELSGL